MKIGVIGLGTVGYGVIEILTNEKTRLEQEIGEAVDVVYGCGLEQIELPEGIMYTNDYNVVVANPEIDVIVELIGGTTIAKDIIVSALNSKKHVVTANKALLSYSGQELFSLAKDNGVHLFYEASVGGGIPVMASQKESLVANNTKEIIGILNGTTNFILTLMERENLDFGDALAIAEGLGYVEANPALDLDGIDAASKIAILAMNGFKTYIEFSQIKPTGIRDITKADMDFAKDLGYRFKLIAQAKKVKDGIGIDIAATLVSTNDLVANVMDAYNVVEISTDYLENVIYYGKGAGRYVTASAVVSDIMKTRQEELWSHDYDTNTKIYPITESRYYIRSDKALPIQYDEYITTGNEHIYISEMIELDTLKEQLKDTECKIFKVRG